MKYFLTIVLITFASLGFGQMMFSATSHDFGELESYDNRFFDIVITNKSPKENYILSVRKPADVVYIQNKSLILKDSSLTIRFQVNPKVKGKFKYEIEVYTSDRNDPTIVKLTGNLNSIENNQNSAFTSCPDFNSHPAGRKANNFDLTVITIDQESKEELAQSTVTMIQNGTPVWRDNTNTKGKIVKEATLGLSYFYATHDGYYPAELGSYVNFKRNVVVIELERDRNPPVVEETIAVIEPTPIPEETVEVIIEINPTDPVVDSDTTTYIPEETIPELASLDPNNFDDELFAPVNVAFVLDVSSSMNQSDKMELMKYSLMQLTDMLRAQDRISIVTYSNDAHVLLEGVSGADKEEIKEEVSKLKASGMTAGGRGIKMGYKQAYKSFIKEGVNHVIIITDGDFNRHSDDYKKAIRKYKRKGINFSVVGVRNKEADKEDMEKAAKLGGGDYIPIFKLSDAQNNLKQAIRQLTFYN